MRKAKPRKDTHRIEPKDVKGVKMLKEQGLTYTSISEILNICISTCQKICKGYYDFMEPVIEEKKEELIKREDFIPDDYEFENYCNTGMVNWDSVSELFRFKKKRFYKL